MHMMDDPRDEALEEAKQTYSGFIKFLKLLSIGWIVLILAMCSNNFLEDGTGAKYDPSWKEDYLDNMGIDE